MHRQSAWLAVALAVVLGVPQAGCAARSKAERAERAAERNRPAGVWPLLEYADDQTDEVDLRIDNRVHSLPTSNLRVFADVAARIIDVGPGIRPAFLIVEGKTPNAFAQSMRGYPVVGVTLGMVKLLGTDEAMWAAVIGHELAHLALHHQLARNARNGGGDVGKGAIAIALAVIGIPFALLAADTASTAVDRSYSQEEELAADELGVNYLRKAEFDPQGALRFQARMATVAIGRGPQFLSTHPSWDARVERLKTLIDAGQR